MTQFVGRGVVPSGPYAGAFSLEGTDSVGEVKSEPAKQVSPASQIPFSRSRSWIAPRAQCGVINAAAAALCSTRPMPPTPFPLLSAVRCSLIADACILKIFIDFCGLSLSCFAVAFISPLSSLFLFFAFFLACIRFRKCRTGCVSVGNLPHAACLAPHASYLTPPAAIEMDMSDSNRNRPPGAAKRSAAAAQTIGISCSPCPCPCPCHHLQL